MIRLGLTGWPISHSLSPRLHRAAFRALGLEGEYNLYPIEPSRQDELAKLVHKLYNGELAGLNVTIPHKQNVLKHVDELTESAEMIGAVNTLFLRDAKVIGGNTDAPGFLADLRNKAGTVMAQPGTAIVLGAGGAARAVIWVLRELSWRIILAARDLKQAQILANYFNYFGDAGGGKILPIKLEASSLLQHVARVNLIVNTTPVGMDPEIGSTPWPNGLALPSNAFIYDLIYNPFSTLLVKQARLAGLFAENGLGMLVEQAALAFELWTGKEPPRDAMVDAVAADL